MGDEFSYLLILLGTLGILSTLFQFLKKLNKIKTYLKVDGVITKSEVKPWLLMESYKDSQLTMIPNNLNISYQYVINNKTYVSKTITKKEIFIFNKIYYLEKYHTSKVVDVYYDPKNPKDAVLELDSNIEIYVMIAFIFSGFIYGGFYYL